VPSVCPQPETGLEARDAVHVKAKMKIAGRTHDRENLPGKRRHTSGRPTAFLHLPHHQPPFLCLCLLFLTIHLCIKCPFQTTASSQWASLARSSRNRPRLQLQKLQSRRLRPARLLSAPKGAIPLYQGMSTVRCNGDRASYLRHTLIRCPKFYSFR
jgi:hypothetical protein